MTNREYITKQHRGSSPNTDTGSGTSSPGSMQSEEWKDLTWYPFSNKYPGETTLAPLQNRHSQPVQQSHVEKNRPASADNRNERKRH